MQKVCMEYSHHGNEISQGYENISVLICHKPNKHASMMKKWKNNAFCFNFNCPIFPCHLDNKWNSSSNSCNVHFLQYLYSRVIPLYLPSLISSVCDNVWSLTILLLCS